MSESGYYDATGGLSGFGNLGVLPALTAHVCNCVGPQGGRPLCPCAMRSVEIRDGRYIQPERDLGPVVAADKRP